MSAACSSRRTCGSVGAATPARLFLAQEHARRRDQREVVMEALPASSLIVIQTQFIF